jgi:hypothetical protein
VVSLERVDEASRPELGPAVAVDHAAGDDVVSAAAGHGHGQGVDGEVGGHAVVDGVADDPA